MLPSVVAYVCVCQSKHALVKRGRCTLYEETGPSLCALCWPLYGRATGHTQGRQENVVLKVPPPPVVVYVSVCLCVATRPRSKCKCY